MPKKRTLSLKRQDADPADRTVSDGHIDGRFLPESGSCTSSKSFLFATKKQISYPFDIIDLKRSFMPNLKDACRTTAWLLWARENL